jgi:predicted acyltransferase
MGASMSLSLSKFEGLNASVLMRKILQRTLLIFACGYLLSWFPFVEWNTAGQMQIIPFEKHRILGVLQRLALTYGLAALLAQFLKTRGIVIVCLTALLINGWALANFGDYTLEGNVGLKLDLWLFGSSHLYKGEGIPFDPEGLLGTLPSLVNVLAGFLMVKSFNEALYVRAWLFKVCGAALCLVLLGLLMNQFIPINKKLWTDSYVLITVGFAMLVLVTLMVWIDIKGHQSFAYFFQVFGKNTLAIYLMAEVGMSLMQICKLSNMTFFEWLYSHLFQNWAGDRNGSLFFAVAYMMVFWGVAYVLDRKKIYIKL